MQCTVCHRNLDEVKKQDANNRAYWQRCFPDVVVCHTCFFNPEEVTAYLQRTTIAHLLWRARKISRAEAVEALNSIRGSGVPMNPNRIRRKS